MAAALGKALRTQRHRLQHALERRGTWTVLIGVGLVGATIMAALNQQEQQPAAAAGMGAGQGAMSGMQAWVAAAAGGAIKKASGGWGSSAAEAEAEAEASWEWYTKPLPPLRQREDIGAFLEVRFGGSINE